MVLKEWNGGVRRYQNKDGTLTELGSLREKGANRKTNLIKKQLGYDVDKRVFYNNDINASKSVSLKKGQKVYHVTPKEIKQLRDGQDLFVSATKTDRDTYKSFLILLIINLFTYRVFHRSFGSLLSESLLACTLS